MLSLREIAQEDCEPAASMFEVKLDGGRIAHCWQAQAQPYQDCTFSAGLVEGIEPDTIYLKLEREDREELYLFLRSDEAQAIAFILNAALWSEQMLEGEKSRDV